jgi:hypothetical protein
VFVIVIPCGSVFIGNVYHPATLPLHRDWVFPTWESASSVLARIPATGNGVHAIAQLLAKPQVFGWDTRY